VCPLETTLELGTFDTDLRRESSRHATTPSTSAIHDMFALPLTKSDTSQPVPAPTIWPRDKVYGLRRFAALKQHPCHCGTKACAGYIVAEEFFEHVRIQSIRKTA